MSFPDVSFIKKFSGSFFPVNSQVFTLSFFRRFSGSFQVFPEESSGVLQKQELSHDVIKFRAFFGKIVQKFPEDSFQEFQKFQESILGVSCSFSSISVEAEASAEVSPGAYLEVFWEFSQESVQVFAQKIPGDSSRACRGVFPGKSRDSKKIRWCFSRSFYKSIISEVFLVVYVPDFLYLLAVSGISPIACSVNSPKVFFSKISRKLS